MTECLQIYGEIGTPPHALIIGLSIGASVLGKEAVPQKAKHSHHTTQHLILKMHPKEITVVMTPDFLSMEQYLLVLQLF
jgi:hypothetical protein